MKKKIVFLDIDGTILTRDGQMPESTKKALAEARANGHEMVLCTGRSATQLSTVTEQADFDGVVCAAGSQVSRGGVLVHNAVMDLAHARALVRYFRDNGMTYFLQSAEGIWSDPQATEQLRGAFEALGRSWEEVGEMFGTMNVVNAPEDTPGIQKCCYYGCPKPAAQVQEELGDYFYVVDSSYKVSRFCDGEITMSGITKAKGMDVYLKAADVPHEDCIAFGDGPNDLEMIEYAAIGVCMGNGTDRLKELADRVCGPIDEDGLYNEFIALGLI